MRPFTGRGLAVLLLAMICALTVLAPVAVAHGGPGSGPGRGRGGGHGHDPRGRPPCSKTHDPRADRPKFCGPGGGAGGGVTTTTKPPTSVTHPPPSTSPPTAPPPSPPPTSPPAPPPTASPTVPPTASPLRAFVGSTADGDGEPDVAEAPSSDDAPVAIGPPRVTPTPPGGPFRWPPFGGGSEDDGIPTRVWVTIALAGALAAAMVVRGGLGRGRPFLSVPDDEQRTLPFE